jgi:tetratricopeptide (TPR) repeat protein
MKILFFLFVAISFHSPCRAQNNPLDSIQQLLSSPAQDTMMANRYIWLGLYYDQKNDSLKNVYANKAVLLSEKLRWTRGVLKGKMLMVDTRNFTKSLSLLFECLETAEEIKDSVALMDCTFLLNITYKFLEDHNKSVEYASRTLLYAKATSDSAWIWNSCYNLGNAYCNLKNKDSALYYSQEAYRYANLLERPIQKGVLGLWMLSEPETIAWSLHAMGRVQELLENWGLAIEYYRKAVPHPNEILQSDLELSIAGYFNKIGKRDSAVMYAKRCMKESLAISYEHNILGSYTALGQAYESLNNDSAVKYFKLVIDVRNQQFSAKTKTDVANLTFNEQQREKEVMIMDMITKEERRRNLQFILLGIGLITFILLYIFVSQSVIIKSHSVKFLGVVALLLVFEFANLLFHPMIANVTHHSPPLMFLIMVCIAALLVPAHHKLEKWITHQLVEKNKRIRLAAARKTIAEIGGE